MLTLRASAFLAAMMPLGAAIVERVRVEQGLTMWANR